MNPSRMAGPHTPNPAQEPEHTPARSNRYDYIRLSDMDEATVVGFDAVDRTVNLRFDIMPSAAIGDLWLVKHFKHTGEP